jgi:hypothetical protein
MTDRIEHRVGSGRSPLLLARIVARVQIFEAQWTDRGDLGDVFPGLRSMKMRRIAGQDDDTPRRIGFHLAGIEPIAEADVGHA